MGRSYTRTPYSGERQNQEDKRLANKRVRQQLKLADELPQGSSYRKMYESWNIRDYGWKSTWREYWNHQLKFWHTWGRWQGQEFPDREQAYWDWYKYYKMK